MFHKFFCLTVRKTCQMKQNHDGWVDYAVAQAISQNMLSVFY